MTAHAFSRSRRCSAGALTLLALALHACVTLPHRTVDDAAGCYYFERDAIAQELQLPWGVRLLADTLTGWPAVQQLPEVRRAVTLFAPGDERTFPFGYWRPLGTDSLEIGYPAGGGLRLTVAVGQARLVGTAVPVGDVLAPPAEPAAARTYPVTLLHARCPDATP
jgi:hypothetical protein